MSLSMKRRVTVLATTISVLLIAGVVFAAWTATAGGAGSADAFDVENQSTIDFDNVGGLYPGHTESGTITVQNNEDFPVVVTALPSAAADEDAALGDCDEADVVADPAAPESTVLEPGDTDTYAVAVTMAADAAQACAGKSFDFTLSATLASVPDAD